MKKICLALMCIAALMMTASAISAAPSTSVS